MLRVLLRPSMFRANRHLQTSLFRHVNHHLKNRQISQYISPEEMSNESDRTVGKENQSEKKQSYIPSKWKKSLIESAKFSVIAIGTASIGPITLLCVPCGLIMVPMVMFFIIWFTK